MFADHIGAWLRRNAACLRHTAPFGGWLLVMLLPWPPSGLKYLAQSAVALLLFLYCRPWRYYPRPRAGLLLPAAGTGLLVCLLWILPESSWFARWESLARGYRAYGILTLGGAPPAAVPGPYAPESAGWPLTLVRLAGSALVIATVEEFFWRGFFLRWLAARDFLKYEFQRGAGMALAVTALVFGFEHTRWLAGCIAGLLYGLLYIKTRDIWAAVAAHVTTNLALGIYVLWTGAYGFW